MTEAPDRGTGSEPFRKTDHRQGTQCGQSTLGSFRMAPIPYSHYQRLLSGGRAQATNGHDDGRPATLDNAIDAAYNHNMGIRKGTMR